MAPLRWSLRSDPVTILWLLIFNFRPLGPEDIDEIDDFMIQCWWLEQWWEYEYEGMERDWPCLGTGILYERGWCHGLVRIVSLVSVLRFCQRPAVGSDRLRAINAACTFPSLFVLFFSFLLHVWYSRLTSHLDSYRIYSLYSKLGSWHNIKHQTLSYPCPWELGYIIFSTSAGYHTYVWQLHVQKLYDTIDE